MRLLLLEGETARILFANPAARRGIAPQIKIRRGDAANPLKESSGSQFYIVQDAQTCAQLDGQYTVFGQTVEGFDVIDKIASVATDYRDRPEVPVKIVTVKLVQE